MNARLGIMAGTGIADYIATVPNLHLYFDAAELALSNGASVNSWASKIVNTGSALAGGATKPTFTANWQNGRPAVQFGAAVSPMTLTLALPTKTELTVLVVGSMTATADSYNQTFFDYAAGNSGYQNTAYQIFRESGGQGVNGMKWRLVDNTEGGVAFGLDASKYVYLVRGRRGGTAGTVNRELYVNGVSRHTGTLSYGTSANLYQYLQVGQLIGGYYPLRGAISMIAVINRYVSDIEAAAINARANELFAIY